MNNYWPFCSTEAAACNPSIALIVGIFLLVILTISLFNFINERKEKQIQAVKEAVNLAWLKSQGLKNQTHRSIIEGFFKVSGSYIIGIPTVDWGGGEAVLSLQKNGRTIALDVDLKDIEWVQTQGTIQPTATFIFDENFLETDFQIGFYEYGNLQAAVEKTSIERILGQAKKIKISLSPEQYRIVHKSII